MVAQEAWLKKVSFYLPCERDHPHYLPRQRKWKIKDRTTAKWHNGTPTVPSFSQIHSHSSRTKTPIFLKQNSHKDKRFELCECKLRFSARALSLIQALQYDE
jgi:hypothetical protein